MRLSFVASGLDTGGAEVALLRLLPALRDFGVESAVLSLRSIGTIGPLLKAQSIPTSHLGLPAPRALLSALPSFAKHVQQWRPKVLHGWMYHGNLAASVVAARAGVPAVWGIRQSLGPGSRDKWLTRRVIQAGALASEQAALIVYNSALAREQHERHGYAARHAVVVPNGFDTVQFMPHPEGAVSVRRELSIELRAPIVGHIARFHPVKDHPSFLRAAARVCERFPDATFVLVGDGVDASRGELTTLISRLGLTRSVRLLGRRKDVPRLLAAFDVACLTSTGESFPNSIGEAMSCGVPCVSTAVGDIAELIGDTGEVVPPSDPEAVAEAVGRLLSLEPAARRVLGARARQRIIDRFSIGEVARRYAELLHSVADQRH